MRFRLSTIHVARDELSENTVKTLELVHAAAGGDNEKLPRYSGELSKLEELETWLKGLSKKVNKAKANGVPG